MKGLQPDAKHRKGGVLVNEKKGGLPPPFILGGRKKSGQSHPSKPLKKKREGKCQGVKKVPPA